jgi:site-specific DNA-adenine methylase
MNRLPKSKRYFSLFFGGGGLENSNYTADAFFVCAEKNPECKKFEIPSMAIIEFSDYKDLLEENVFIQEDFIFSDPPYMFSTRSSGKKYYKYEFTTKNHIEFLNYMISLPCKIMITHPECDLYNEYLKGWSKEELNYMTRNGWFKDTVWTNYNTADIELLNYDCLGTDFTDRQRIKRQRNNIVNKFKNLDNHVRLAIVKELKENNLI